VDYALHRVNLIALVGAANRSSVLAVPTRAIKSVRTSACVMDLSFDATIQVSVGRKLDFQTKFQSVKRFSACESYRLSASFTPVFSVVSTGHAFLGGRFSGNFPIRTADDGDHLRQFLTPTVQFQKAQDFRETLNR